jgi:hypothetical protein
MVMRDIAGCEIGSVLATLETLPPSDTPVGVDSQRGARD